jgi:hypothetical protein
MAVDASDHWSECSFGLFEALNHLYGASRSSPLATPTEGRVIFVVGSWSFQKVSNCSFRGGALQAKTERHNPEKHEFKYEHKWYYHSAFSS